MITLDQYKSVYEFPPDDLDPKSKAQKDYCLSFAKAIYSEWVQNRGFFNELTKARIEFLRAYGNGAQDQNIYKNLLIGDQIAVEGFQNVGEFARKGFMNVNWDVLSVAPKFKNLIIALFEETEHDIFADAIDPLSVDYKEIEKFKMWVGLQFREQLAAIDQELGLEENEDYKPESFEELELLAENGYFKLAKESAIEKAIKYTLEISDWNEIKRRLIEDLYELNTACVKSFFCPKTRKFKTRYADPANMVLSWGASNTFDDVWYAGEFRIVTIKELRAKLPKITEAEIKSLAQSYSGRMGNPKESEFYQYQKQSQYNQFGYDQYKVLVLDCEYLTKDSEYVQKRKTSSGKEMYFDEKYGKVNNKPNRETIISKVDMWYKNTWVVGSEYCYDYGAQNDMVRKEDNSTECSYKVYKLPGKSRLELIIPNLDNLQLTWLKLQNAIAMAAPAGLAIEAASLQNISLGNKKMSPLDILKIRTQNGTLLYRSTTHRTYMPNPAMAKPIQELQGGLGGQLQEFMALMNQDLEFIREISGVSAPMDASKTNPEMGLGVTQLAQTAATRSLAGIYAAYISLKERLARDVSGKIQNAVTLDGQVYEGYFNAIGKGTTQILRIDKDIAEAKYNYILKARPGEQEKQAIRQSALESLKASKNGYGGLSQADYLLIERMLAGGNLKFAEMLFAKKERDALMRQQQIAMQKEEFQQKAAQLLEAQKHREKMEANQSELNLKLQVIKAETEKALIVLRETHRLKMQEMGAEGLMDTIQTPEEGMPAEEQMPGQEEMGEGQSEENMDIQNAMMETLPQE